MKIVKNQYTPPAAPATTTVAPVYPTTTIVCSVTVPPLTTKAQNSQTVRIPGIGFYSPSGGNAQFTKAVIVTIPATGTLRKGGTTLAANAELTLAELQTLNYVAPASFAGATFTIKIVTTCGESAAATITIAKEETPTPAGCPTTTTTP